MRFSDTHSSALFHHLVASQTPKAGAETAAGLDSAVRWLRAAARVGLHIGAHNGDEFAAKFGRTHYLKKDLF